MERVKTALILATAVFAISYAPATTMVVVPLYRPSSPNIDLAVTQGSKYLKGVRVDLYRETENGETQFWTALSNESGLVSPPELPDGKYRIFAASEKREAILYLEVSRDRQQGNRFALDLVRPDRLDAAAETPIAARLQDFDGVVQDENQAVISKVEIEVLRKGSIDEDDVARIESRDRGQFSVHLETGTYIAVFRRPGFANVVLPFEIQGKGWKGLKLTMQIANSHGALAISELNPEK
jgi:hypothetical protein